MTHPHLFLAAEGSEPPLFGELHHTFRAAPSRLAPGILGVSSLPPDGTRLPNLVFARQWLPEAQAVRAASVREWTDAIAMRIREAVPDDRPWRFHVAAHYGTRTAAPSGARAAYTRHRFGPAEAARSRPHPAPLAPEPAAGAGRHRCQLIEQSVEAWLARHRRHLLRHRRTGYEAWAPEESFVQALLAAPDHGWISVATAPLPATQPHLVSPFPLGEVPVASDKAAPSRAFAKLVEAEQRLGYGIRPGDACVDLGAAPGSWTYVALQRGARVLAVDRAPLRPDLARHPNLTTRQGDAFEFVPAQPVDWLLCDVIAAPERCVELALRWLERAWCRHLVVTVKFAGHPDPATLHAWKQSLLAVRPDLRFQRLCANKNEACLFG